MAYAKTNPPFRMSEYPMTGFGSSQPGLGVWGYRSADAHTVVRVIGYFTDAAARGMQVDDLVWVINTATSPHTITLHSVSAISAAGAADLSDAGVTLSTNTD